MPCKFSKKIWNMTSNYVLIWPIKELRNIHNYVIIKIMPTLNKSIDDSFYRWWPCRVFYNIFEHVNIWSVLLFQVSRPITVNWDSEFLELNIWEKPHCTFGFVRIDFWKFSRIEGKVVDIFRIFSTLLKSFQFNTS